MPYKFILKNGLKRFWSKVNKTSTCWLWEGAKTPLGYGNIKFNGKYWRAHRLAWFLTYGSDPTLHVLHHCDVRNCVNTAHLFLGTDKDNVDDMVRKNRQQKTFSWVERRHRDAFGRFAATPSRRI